MILKKMFKLFLSSVLSIAILSLIIVPTDFSGVHIDNTEGYTDYKWESNQFKSTIQEGFSWFNMDENGFNNISTDYSDLDILLLGSSHMEAMNINKDETVSSLLNQDVELNMKTYNIGVSGHTIYRCFSNLDAAIDKFSPKKYVIIETDSIDLDVDKMLKVIENDNGDKIPSYDSGLMYFIQKNIYAVKPIFKQITEMIKNDKKSLIGTEKDNIQKKINVDDDYKEVINDFLNRASNRVKKSGAKLILFYHPKTTLDKEGNLIMKSEISEAWFSEMCKKNDIIFVNMRTDFEDLYRKKHKLPHGFSNSAVGVGHLNKYGHEVIAHRLKSVIENLEGDKDANN